MADIPLLQGAIEILQALGNRVLLAALVFLVGAVIARLLRNLARKAMGEFGFNKFILRMTNVDVDAEELIGLIVLWSVYGLTALLILSVLGIEQEVITILGLIVLGMLLLSVLLSVAQAVPNISAGLLIRRRKMLRNGDTLTLRSIQGTVRHVGLFDVMVQTRDKEVVYIPNQSLLREKHFTVRKN